MIIERMTHLLASRSEKIFPLVSRYFGGITSSPKFESEGIDQILIQYDLFHMLIGISYGSNAVHIREAMFLISNLVASSQKFCQLFVNNESYALRAMVLAQNSNCNIRDEAVWVLTNLIGIGNKDTDLALFKLDDGLIIEVLLANLKRQSNKDILINILTSLRKLQELDSLFKMQGTQGSVYVKMDAEKLVTYLEMY